MREDEFTEGVSVDRDEKTPSRTSRAMFMFSCQGDRKEAGRASERVWSIWSKKMPTEQSPGSQVEKDRVTSQVKDCYRSNEPTMDN